MKKRRAATEHVSFHGAAANLDSPVKRPPSGPGRTAIRLAVGEADKDALTGVIEEWLVPVLVQQFLDERRCASTVKSEKLSSKPLGKGGADIIRIR